MLPQFSIHTIKETPARTFVRRRIDGEIFQNWKTELVLFVFKK